MIGLDTNVVIRYLVQDDPIQAQRAAHWIENAWRRGDALFINLVVLCEVVWVLQSAYGYPRAEILEVIEKLLSTAELEIEDHDVARMALADYRNGTGDYADCVIGRRNRSLDCDVTLTFDRGLKRLDTFEIL